MCQTVLIPVYLLIAWQLDLTYAPRTDNMLKCLSRRIEPEAPAAAAHSCGCLPLAVSLLCPSIGGSSQPLLLLTSPAALPPPPLLPARRWLSRRWLSHHSAGRH